MENKLNELKEVLEQRYDRQFTEDEIISHCVSIIYNGVFEKGWSLNGVKLDGLEEFRKWN